MVDGLDLSAREMKELQDSDETLAELRRMAEKGNARFIWKNSLLYKKEG